MSNTFEEKLEYIANWWAVDQQQSNTANAYLEEIEQNPLTYRNDPDILDVINWTNRTYASILAFNNKYNID